MTPPRRDCRFTASSAVIAAMLAIAGCDARPAQPPPQPQTASEDQSSSIDEVLANIRSQQVGNHTVGDLQLPEPFLRRVADRIICEAFEDRFRIVVDDHQADSRGSPEAQATERSAATHDENAKPLLPTLTTIDNRSSAAVNEYRSKLIEAIPPLSGFRAPIGKDAEVFWPFEPPDKSASESLRTAAEIVGKRLAADGLLPTLAGITDDWRAAGVLQTADDQKVIDSLRTVGFPVDWLECFSIEGHKGAASIVRWMAEQRSSRAAQSPQELKSQLAKAEFHFAPSQPGFQADSESGEHNIKTIRLQLTRGDYWQTKGDGGNIDMVRQLIEKCPAATFVASIEGRFVNPFRQTAATWPEFEPSRIALAVVDHPIAQWAQDNGKFGHASAQETPQDVLLVPRFASRGEAGSVFVPGESFVADNIIASGLRVVQSPLLFQGGNLLVVADPRHGERLLLIGEAEINRNFALGLSQQQIIDAFRIEFGVDRCIVLPTASFHLDLDISVRAHGGELVALVNDTTAGAASVLELALDVLQENKRLSADAAASIRQDLHAGHWREAATAVGAILFAESGQLGHFPLSFATLFSAGPADSGVGNLERVLLALDTLASKAGIQNDLPLNSPQRDYYMALARLEQVRQSMHDTLHDAGFRIVPVPALVGAKRGIGYVNGIHDRNRYLMPAYGGIFAALDEQAANAIRHAMPDLMVDPILTAESQRRGGGLHCSCSVLVAR